MNQPSHIPKLFRWAANGTWWSLVIAALFFNFRLYMPTPLASSNDTVPRDLLAQLAANRSALAAGAPSQMQQYFPEGYYFSYLFHGLTWVELAMRDEARSQQAITESLDCLSKLESPSGRQPFPSYLPPDHGMFYAAWKCCLRAGVVVLQQGGDPNQLGQLRRECDAIAKAIEDSATPFLASYDQSAWPCDTLPAIHALSTYDRITSEDRYEKVIASWLRDARERLDPQTGLLPHTAQLPDGRHISGARATSQVIILRYLPDIDATFAKDQYERFRRQFLTTFVGAPCLLEYPSGVSGPGDVDSGPLIIGRSVTGTVVMIAVAQVYGDQSLANAIAQAGETVGLPWTSGNQKRYAGGLIPIGDIIVAYAQVARPWFAQREHFPEQAYRIGPLWRWKIHACTSLLFLPALVRFVRRRAKSHANGEEIPSVQIEP